MLRHAARPRALRLPKQVVCKRYASTIYERATSCSSCWNSRGRDTQKALSQRPLRYGWSFCAFLSMRNIFIGHTIATCQNWRAQSGKLSL
eukprot:3172676-Pleurochrysis_carterae.AAC.1